MLVMNKKTFQTVAITVVIVLLLQFAYIKTASIATLIKLNTSIKNFPDKQNVSLPTFTASDFEIVEVKTGLKETSTLWFPLVFVRLKNISGKDITQHHELKVVYIDSHTSEVVNTDDCDISGSTELFPKDTNRKFELNSTFTFDITKEKTKKEMRKKKIQVKLYLDDKLIGIYPLQNKTIYFKNF